MNSVKLVISQFADDTGLFLEFVEEMLTEVINVLTCIEQQLGA